MPTKKRPTVPGALVHLMARGIDGQHIFRDDSDRIRLLSLLETGLRRLNYQCYAWTLMDNHYHLLLRCSDYPLDRLMRPLHASYAKYYNQRYQRRGYLFQDRFKSIVTQDQGYIEELIRYIHLNPLRAGICTTPSELDRYPWSGHAVLMGKRSCGFLTTTPVLRRFGKTRETQLKNYRTFLLDGVDTLDDNWLVTAVRRSNRGVDRKDQPECWVIGDPDFVRTVMQKALVRDDLACHARLHITLDDVFALVARHCGVDKHLLKRRSRNTAVSRGRILFSILACKKLGFRIKEAANLIGVSSPAVSQAIRNGQDVLAAEVDILVTKLSPG